MSSEWMASKYCNAVRIVVDKVLKNLLTNVVVARGISSACGGWLLTRLIFTNNLTGSPYCGFDVFLPYIPIEQRLMN